METNGTNLEAPRITSTPQWVVCPGPREVAREAAQRFVKTVGEAQAARKQFSVALSGGQTPALFYRELASKKFRAAVDWSRVLLFWSDERAVPPDDPASNFGLAQREFISRVDIPVGNVHRMEAERTDIDRAALEYESLLRKQNAGTLDGVPRLDLVLLGLGTDGHTASLFPRSEALGMHDRLVVASRAPAEGMRRLTFTLPLLNAARRVWFLVTGRAKSGVLRDVIKDEGSEYPARRVRPLEGELLFLLDQEAAESLAETRRG